MLRTLPKSALGPNHWAFITGGAVVLLPEPAAAHQRQAACQQALEELSQQIRARPSVMPVLEKKLVMLSGADGSLAQEELLLVLRHSGLQAEQEVADALVAGLPGGKPRRVDAAALLRHLRA